MKLSLCMIVKDEEEVLARCLDSVKDCVDEIIIVDTGSHDQTREIAGAYASAVYDFVWKDDFSAARNFSFSKATGDYILWLDADDCLSPENGERLLALKKTLADGLYDRINCPYCVAFDDSGSPTYRYIRERILKKESCPPWQGRVHEAIPPYGKIFQSDFAVFHLGSKKSRGDRNLRIYEKWAEEEPLSPRDLFYYGRELYYHKLYTAAIAVLREAIESDLWYVNKIEACKISAKCFAEKGEREKAFRALFTSFLFGEPRASVACEIAALFQGAGQTREAIFWYETALSCRDHTAEGDFEEPFCRTLTPLLQLVCLYYATGDSEKSLFYHKKTEELFPSHPSVLYNKKFFESPSSPQR